VVPTRTATPTMVPTRTVTRTATPTVVPTRSPTATATPAATPTLPPEACLPSSSIGVLVQGTNAIAYAPQGNWRGGVCGSLPGSKAVAVVPVETSAGIGTGGKPSLITTPQFVNSCSSNSTSGQTVCVANNTDVYLIKGTTLSTTL